MLKNSKTNVQIYQHLCVLYSSNTVSIATIPYNYGSCSPSMTVLTYRGKQYDTVEHQKEVLDWKKMTREAGPRFVYRGVEQGSGHSHENTTVA